MKQVSGLMRRESIHSVLSEEVHGGCQGSHTTDGQ